MTLNTADYPFFDVVTPEELNAFKRLIKIVWHDSLEKQNQNLAIFEDALNDEECVGNINILDDLVSHLADSEFSITRYEFEWDELDYRLLTPLSDFAKKHGLQINFDDIPDDDDVLTTLSAVNDRLNDIGFSLIFWDRGLDFYSLFLVKNNDVTEVLDIGELIDFDFLIPAD